MVPRGCRFAWITDWGEKMAGDFVMVQFATPRKPEVLRMASILEVPPSHAFGICVIAWMWFDEQSEDGHVSGVTPVTLDAVVGHVGFSDALRQVGWLNVRDGALQLPNFDRLMGESSKKRAKDAKRQQKHRHKSVTKVSQKECDKSVTKEEKRREENIDTPKAPKGAVVLPELPLILNTPQVRNSLEQWLKYKGKTYKPQGMTAMVNRAVAIAKEQGTQAIVDAIERAMANGWKGWDFPDKSPAKPPAPTTEPIGPAPPMVAKFKPFIIGRD